MFFLFCWFFLLVFGGCCCKQDPMSSLPFSANENETSTTLTRAALSANEHKYIKCSNLNTCTGDILCYLSLIFNAFVH